jgi:hypothetical protein
MCRSAEGIGLPELDDAPRTDVSAAGSQYRI